MESVSELGSSLVDNRENVWKGQTSLKANGSTLRGNHLTHLITAKGNYDYSSSNKGGYAIRSSG